MQETNRQIFDTNQAAEYLGVAKDHIYVLIREDKTFPVFRIGKRKHRYLKEELDAWIKKGGYQKQS